MIGRMDHPVIFIHKEKLASAAAILPFLIDGEEA